MRLTQVLNGPPIFRYWKDFGAGVKRRQPHFKQWRYKRIAHFARRKIPDHTIPKDMLPPGSRILNGEDFLTGHIDAMPDQIIEHKDPEAKVIFDHPWPYNVVLDPVDYQTPLLCYDIQTRFYRPIKDSQVLTNSFIETDSLKAYPPLELSNQHMNIIERQIDWATKGDSVLVRLPRDYQANWPKLNIKPKSQYGLSKERTETNIMNILTSFSQTLLSKYYYEENDQAKLNDILNYRSLAYPHCVVPFDREQTAPRIHMDLFIDSMILGKKSLPQINSKPVNTIEYEPVNIEPRTWRSLLPKSRVYSPSWSFTLPRDAHLHTIQLGSRIKRKHQNSDEMMARLMVHSFGLASQFARLREVSVRNMAAGQATSNQASSVLENPLEIEEVNCRDLSQPIVLQSIGYDHHMGEFHFMRYQLNTVNFDDKNPKRVKNQVWHSGPISDLNQAVRFYLDFQTFDSTQVDRMLTDTLVDRQAKLDLEKSNVVEEPRTSPGQLAETY